MKNKIYKYIIISFAIVVFFTVISLVFGDVEEKAVVMPQSQEMIESPMAATTSSQTALNELSNVVEVIDGDTIKVSIAGSIETLRLIGIDTPETVDPRKPVQCFGVEASNKAKELLVGKKVRLEKDLTQGERDKYDRLLRFVYLEDGRFYNKLMISEGYANEYTYQSNPYKYQLDFIEAARIAREQQKGLWDPNTCNGDTSKTAEIKTPPPIINTSVSNEGETAGPKVKKSNSDICHESGVSQYYDRTKNYKAYSSIEECINSGGRLPK